MNINDLNKIHPINIEARVGEVEADGTFKEILNAVLEGKIEPIVNNVGDIIGGSYNMPATDLVEDNINQIRFERRYWGKPLMSWMEKSLQLKVDSKVEVYGIKEVVEDGDDIKVILNNDEEIEISKKVNYNYDDDENENSLPEEIYLYRDLEIEDGIPSIMAFNSARDIRKAVKNTYGYFLAKSYDVEKNLDYDEKSDDWILKNVQWGRKASENELDY